MRMVIFSKHDLEAITVVDVSESLIRELSGGTWAHFWLRMRARIRYDVVKFYDPAEPVGLMDTRVINILCEPFYRRREGSRYLTEQQCWEHGINYDSMFNKTWIGIADDDALELMSAYLPGQRADVQRDCYMARLQGIFEGWQILGGM